MTTIAWDGATLAADRQSELGSIKFEESKLVRVDIINPDLTAMGWLTGEGRAEYTAMAARWISAGSPPETKPEMKDDDWAGLLLIGDKCYFLETGLVPMPCPERIALGSGKQAAMAAMHLGKTAAEAVAVACWIDPSTGYGVDSVKAGSTKPEFSLPSRP